MEEHIKNRVHELYWNEDINCARMAIICLSELFETAVEPQTIWSAVGMHGVGGYRALHRPPYYGLPPYGGFCAIYANAMKGKKNFDSQKCIFTDNG